MEKKWRIKDYANAKELKYLSQALNIDEVLANLLIQRGIKTYEGAKQFFRPNLYEHLHDPFLMKDMDLAIERLQKAINKKERILVYGDYDVDGTTSVSLVYLFIKDFHPYIDYYIPDRYSEGYGISTEGIDYAKKNDYSLIIALDCGIKAVDKIEYANKLGVDFIICDHHNPGSIIPDAVAVLDPKRIDCEYPFKELSGCGVGFKFLQAYALAYDVPFYKLEPFLDLVAVSIASDIVPIIGENRTLAFHGLKQLNENPSNGLKSIIKFANLENKTITISDIVFKIGPRINAAGRISTGAKSVELLVAGSAVSAKQFGFNINSINNERRELDQQITNDAINTIEKNQLLKSKKATVLYNSTWHKGVIGIVASRLSEHYYRPTVILTESNGFATGSARSVDGFDLYQAIESCSDLLENFGGHMYAAGLTMKIDKIPEFDRRFIQYVNKNITKEQMTPIIDIDVELRLKEITPKFYKILKQFAPFGPRNMSPVFLTEHVTDFGTGKKVGKDDNHLKLDLMEFEDTTHVIPAIAFQQAEYFNIIKKRIPFSIIYSIDENEFRGKTNIQLMIKDIKFDF